MNYKKSRIATFTGVLLYLRKKQYRKKLDLLHFFTFSSTIFIEISSLEIARITLHI